MTDDTDLRNLRSILLFMQGDKAVTTEEIVDHACAGDRLSALRCLRDLREAGTVKYSRGYYWLP